MTLESAFWEKMPFIPDTQILHILAERIGAEAYEAPTPPPPPPPPLAQSCLQAAADMGDTEAMMQLGLIAMKADDSPGGYDWYRKAAMAGNGEGMFWVGYAHLFGENGVSKNPAMALEWYQRAGDAGYAEGYWGVAEIYHHGRMGAVDMEKACHWYARAAEGGDVKSMYAIGDYYQTLSRNTETDEDRQAARQKAVHWLMRAAERGSRPALSVLATAYYALDENSIVPQDMGKAMRLIQHNLKQEGDWENIAMLGYFYETGLEGQQNPTLAALLYIHGIESRWADSEPEYLDKWRNRALFEAHREQIGVLWNQEADFFLSGVTRLSKDVPVARAYLENQFFNQQA